MTDVVAQHQSEQTFLDFKVSNDFIFGTDHYFTNGLQLRIYDNFISNISKELFKDLVFRSEEDIIQQLSDERKIVIIDGFDHIENYNDKNLRIILLF